MATFRSAIHPHPSSPPGVSQTQGLKDDPHAARRDREGRKLAFLALYEVDVARHPPGEVLARLASERKAKEDSVQLARRLVAGTLRHRSRIDGLIQEKAPAWPLSNMSPVDRNILRLGIYELHFRRVTVPVKVAISEAVELAKGYGSESSQRFVNGVLGHVLESLLALAEPGVRPESKGPLEEV